MSRAPDITQSPSDVAFNYGSKPKIAQAVQNNIVHPTVGQMAAMLIDRIVAAQIQPPTETVRDKTFAPPQGPQGGPPPQGAPQGGPPQGGPPPGAPPMQMASAAPPPPGGPPPQGPVGMAEGGLTSLPVPDYMFDEQTFAGGGIVAFRTGDAVEGDGFFNRVRNRDFTGRNKELTEDELRILREKLRAGRLSKNSGDGVNLLAKLNEPYEGRRGMDLMASLLPDFTGNKDIIPVEPTMVSPVTPEVRMPQFDIAPKEAPAVAPVVPPPPAAPVVRAPRTNITDIIRSAAKAKNVPTPTARPDLPTDVAGAAGVAPALTGEALIEQRKKDYAEAYKMPEYKGTSAEDKAARKKEDFWSAMAQAGFGMMAGTSQNALTNIGEGLKAAMPTMQAALKERRADEKEERKEEFAYRLAQSGVKGKAYEFGVEQFDKLRKSEQDRALAQLQVDAQRDIARGNNATSLAAARIAASKQSGGEQAVAAYYNQAIADAVAKGIPITPQLKAKLLADANVKNTTLNTGMRTAQAGEATRATVMRAIQAQVLKSATAGGYLKAKKLNPKLTKQDWEASEVERLKGQYGTLFTEDLGGTEPPAGFIEQN